MLELTIKNKPVEIKFNFKLMYLLNKRLSTKNKETGDLNNDGVGNFFAKIVQEDVQALVDLITAIPGKYTDNDALDAIENYIGDEESLKSLFGEIKDEMVTSGFFKEQISKYIKNMETVQSYLNANGDQEKEMQVKIIKDQISTMKAALK